MIEQVEVEFELPLRYMLAVEQSDFTLDEIVQEAVQYHLIEGNDMDGFANHHREKAGED